MMTQKLVILAACEWSQENFQESTIAGAIVNGCALQCLAEPEQVT